MMLTGKKVAILVEDMFNIHEFWYPYYRLQEEGARVVVVGSGRKKKFIGKPATEVAADMAADQVKAADFDGILIPGGYAPDMMRRCSAMVQLVADACRAGRMVAAICHAGWMLCSAEVLQGRKVTSFFAIKDDMVHAGAAWVDEPVVIDRNLVTSRTPDDLPQFMPAVIRALAGQV
jgi:protease I